jgi:hypothetical protein
MTSRLIVSLGTVSVAAALLGSQQAAASGIGYVGVANANPKTAGIAYPDVLTPELIETRIMQGATKLENGSALLPFYGFNGDGPMLPAPGAVQMPGSNVEATKTEGDKNTYLIVTGQIGPDPTYDYGTHFIFQGHELGTTDPSTGQTAGYITRVNLDADFAHRVTLFAAYDVNGNNVPEIDGSTWDPFCRRLLFTKEAGSNGGVWQSTLNYPPTVMDISAYLGRAGYEGIQNDSDGNVFIVEDTGGPTGTVYSHAKQPNSFIFRFLPYEPRDLTMGGTLQALQVISHSNPGQPIVFHAGQADADILSQDVLDLHTYGLTFVTHWVTVHDTNADGATPFDANALAKAASATPFKRPENGQFRPGTSFTEFYFDETGDTNSLTEAGTLYGGFGSLFKWHKTSANDGTLSLLFRGDAQHAAFDNVAFWGADVVIAVEDRGDTLHTQGNALDSAWAFDVTADYGNPSTPAPVRVIAQGRDPLATIDSGIGSIPNNGFQNEGDNEITGIHVSDGDATPTGILGAKVPTPFSNGWRAFYSQQHGENNMYELLPAPH